MSHYILEEPHNWAVCDTVLIMEEIAWVACRARVVIVDAICASFLADHTSPGSCLRISSYYCCAIYATSSCCCIKEVCWKTLFTFCCSITAFTIAIANIAIVCGVIKEKSFRAFILSWVARIASEYKCFLTC
jgi:hypothetical protein